MACENAALSRLLLAVRVTMRNCQNDFGSSNSSRIKNKIKKQNNHTRIKITKQNQTSIYLGVLSHPVTEANKGLQRSPLAQKCFLPVVTRNRGRGNIPTSTSKFTPQNQHQQFDPPTKNIKKPFKTNSRLD